MLPPWLASAIDTDQIELVGIILLVSFCVVAIWLADIVGSLLTASTQVWRSRTTRSAVGVAPVDANRLAAHGTPNPSERT